MSFIEGTRIPKTIYICFKHKRIPSKVIANWKRLNPDYNVFLFDDEDCVRFLTEQYGPVFAHIFRSIPDGAIKSDFWRVCVLYSRHTSSKVYIGVFRAWSSHANMPLNVGISATW